MNNRVSCVAWARFLIAISVSGVILSPTGARASSSPVLILANAEGLAAAGLTAAEVAAYFDALESQEAFWQWHAAAVRLEEHVSSAAALAASAWAGGTSAERALALESAQSEANLVREESEALFAACVDAAAAWIADRRGEDAGAIFRRVSACSRSDIPTHFLSVVRTEREWGLLRSALSRRERSEALTPDEATILHQLESDPVVLLALVRIAHNAGAIEAAIVQHIFRAQQGE